MLKQTLKVSALQGLLSMKMKKAQFRTQINQHVAVWHKTAAAKFEDQR
jgi:hypothetical protein